MPNSMLHRVWEKHQSSFKWTNMNGGWQHCFSNFLFKEPRKEVYLVTRSQVSNTAVHLGDHRTVLEGLRSLDWHPSLPVAPNALCLPGEVYRSDVILNFDSLLLRSVPSLKGWAILHKYACSKNGWRGNTGKCHANSLQSQGYEFELDSIKTRQVPKRHLRTVACCSNALLSLAHSLVHTSVYIH